MTGTTMIMNDTPGSPRGPDIGSEETSAGDPLLQKLANDGYKAIKELERILFFTDLDGGVARAQHGLDALENLENLLANVDEISQASVQTGSSSQNSALNRKPSIEQKAQH